MAGKSLTLYGKERSNCGQFLPFSGWIIIGCGKKVEKGRRMLRKREARAKVLV
jgi:hypothetical protein